MRQRPRFRPGPRWGSTALPGTLAGLGGGKGIRMVGNWERKEGKGKGGRGEGRREGKGRGEMEGEGPDQVSREIDAPPRRHWHRHFPLREWVGIEIYVALNRHTTRHFGEESPRWISCTNTDNQTQQETRTLSQAINRAMQQSVRMCRAGHSLNLYQLNHTVNVAIQRNTVTGFPV